MLRKLGWDDSWTAAFEKLAVGGQPGRIVRAGRLLRVRTERQEVFAECPQGLQERPICGDWVALDLHADARVDEASGIIRATLPRRNAIIRKAAGVERPQGIVANIDGIWLVCGLDRDQGIRSLARYQAMTRLDDVSVTVVLNKLDLVDDIGRKLSLAQAKAPDLEVLPVSAQLRQGLEWLEAKLQPCQTTALIGPSGVGKSSLINALTQSVELRTDAVRQKDHRGCHTTSAGQLVATVSGALLIDTPGLRELGLWQAAGLDNSYADILELSEGCRFRDCSHGTEPGCRIKLALAQGELEAERFQSYLELQRERAFLDRGLSRTRPRKQPFRPAKFRQF